MFTFCHGPLDLDPGFAGQYVACVAQQHVDARGLYNCRLPITPGIVLIACAALAVNITHATSITAVICSVMRCFWSAGFRLRYAAAIASLSPGSHWSQLRGKCRLSVNLPPCIPKNEYPSLEPVGLEGRHVGSAWRVGWEGKLGGSSWRVGLEGKLRPKPLQPLSARCTKVWQKVSHRPLSPQVRPDKGS